jgi:hypothetical protein
VPEEERPWLEGFNPNPDFREENRDADRNPGTRPKEENYGKLKTGQESGNASRILPW